VGQRQPKIFYYEADGLGSVTSLTDPTGAVAATYTYDSFGFMTASTGSATNWLRYTARQFDSDTALYYYRARYYDPTTGRFLSEDPIRFKGGVNFYSYVHGSPLDFTDPSGLCPNKVDCNTMLPNGQTIGQVVQLERAELQSVWDQSLQGANSDGQPDPLGATTGTFIAIAKSHGPIDFKNSYKGQANATMLGQAGNFAYYAIGSGFLPSRELDIGAGLYGLYSAIFGNKHFSDLTGPMFSDTSAASVRDAALASNGCKQ
jgi:RHS repeat-associated protein